MDVMAGSNRDRSYSPSRRDWSSKTAVLGDKITAKIAHCQLRQTMTLPGSRLLQWRPRGNRLIEDVEIELSNLRHVPVRIKY